MNRRNSQINPSDPLQTRPSFPRSSHGIRSSDIRSDQDTRCRKRVTFADEYNNNPLSDSPIPLQEIRVQKSDDPKTSEYAFFKKLKADAGHRFQSQSPDEDEQKSKKFKSSDYAQGCLKEITNIIKDNSTNFRSSIPVEDVTHNNYDSFLSPVDRVSKNSEIDFKQSSTTFGAMCSIQKSMEQDSNNMRPGGAHFQHAEIFSRKRQKLRQWVKDTSFPEIDELCSKGYDFVSVVLSRLYPCSKEKNGFKIPKSGKVDSNAKAKFVASPESDFHFTELHQMSARSFTEVEYRPYLDNGSSSCWLDKARERVFLDSEYHTCHARHTLLPHNLREPSFELGVKNAILCTNNDSIFDSPFRKYEPLHLSHLEELDDFYSLDESSLERDPYALYLGWDFETKKNASNSSDNCQNKELIMYPTSLTSCGHDNQESVDNRCESYGAKMLCGSYNLSNYSPELFSLLHSHSASYCKHDFGRHFLQRKDVFADLDRFPLSRTTNFVNLIEDCNYDPTSKGSSIFLESHHWFMSKIFNERNHHLGTEARFSPGMDIDVGWKCLSLSDSPSENYSSTYHAIEFPQKESISLPFLTKDQYRSSLDGSNNRKILGHFNEDMANIHDWSSFYFQISLENEKASHLLLDKSSWEDSEGELHCDDNEVKYI